MPADPLAEDPADAVIGLYTRHALAWAADRGEALMEGAWLDRFCALLPEGAAILDLGCGSGMPIAGHLIGRGYRVTGVDASPGLLALCRARFPRQEWLLADMRALDLGRRFEGLLAWDSFFHLPQADQRAMVRTFAAHAAPGAALMFTSGPSHGIAMGEYRGEALHHASLDAAEYRSLLAAQGFAVVAHTVEDPGCGGHTVWLARRAREARPGPGKAGAACPGARPMP